MSSDSPILLIVSSPSGAGKTTLTSALRERIGDIRFSVSHTTRKPREGEQDGREYHFIDKDAFNAKVRQGDFLEWAEVHGNLYGTAKSEIERANSARGLLFDVDQQGARQIKSVRPDTVSVFILPPSMKVLEERLRGRASDDEATIVKRFSAARNEIGYYGSFDYVLLNDDLEQATQQLISVFLAEECRRVRTAPIAERLLAEERGFGGTTPPNR